MFLKISGNSGMDKEELFVEGKCTNWQKGKGLFLWVSNDDERYIFNFEEGGRFRCYTVNEEIRAASEKLEHH